MQRILLRLEIVVLAFLLLVVVPKVSAQLTRLNIGYVGINSENVIGFIAKETGIFARNGLDVQLIYFASGSTAIVALLSGETPISQTAGPGMANAVLNGFDAVMVAGGVITLDYQLLSRPEIKTPEQLKGGLRRRTATQLSGQLVARYALQRIGLTPVKDVALPPSWPTAGPSQWRKRACKQPYWLRRQCI